MTEKFAEYWKDDFVPLQAAGTQVNAVLREDEQDSDLYRRIGSGGGANQSSSHLYFPIDSNNNNNQGVVPPLQQLQHRKTVPLPPLLQEKLHGIKYQLRMGLLGAADLAWIAVDDIVYLWRYSEPHSSCLDSFSVPSRQNVVSVGLMRPKEGTCV